MKDVEIAVDDYLQKIGSPYCANCIEVGRVPGSHMAVKNLLV